MDLFHTITQSLDNVLTCDWYETFKNYGTDQSTSDDNTMDTETGGETSQYESIKTVTEPTSKQRGQLGSGPNTSEEAPASEERGEKTAENIRYGQNISESGMGGMTNPPDDSAGGKSGSGSEFLDNKTDEGARAAQGYGPGSDHSNTEIGG
ncbi:hypothetical protein EDD37DRAFT_338523 [Exophiala viscosa]|uniref:Uncharacterized protein n=1 Tax=Exophiala viscosa TaxID=2486360 RepID=A0AAN6ID92_9EURO|nr:hypothetical protein EDD36DRAFT_465353 [Exophiala viscosa]KAI1626295.1 hypothetical protein EDD37DRAFT_338523 [Exophiala viscosa]